MPRELQEGQRHGDPEAVGARAPARLGAVLPAAPGEEEPWLLAPHGSSRTADPTRLIPHASSHTAHPTRLIPHSSPHKSHPARIIPPGSPLHARCRPRARWIGSGAGKESGKQETGSVEHRSRATRNQALAKNSSRAAPGAGQLPFGREGARPPPADPLGRGPHVRRELPGELPGSHGAGPAIREEEPRRGRGSGEEPSKPHKEQKQLGAEGCGACRCGMGKGRGLSQPRAPRGPSHLPRLLWGVGAACVPMDNTQCWGDRDPQLPRAGLPEPLGSQICHFWAAARLRGQGYREASLCCSRCAVSIPAPADGDGTGSGGPCTAPASLPSPAASPALASAATMPGNGGSGQETGGTTVLPTDTYSPRGGCAPCCAWDRCGRTASFTPPARSCDPRSLCGVLGTAGPSTAGWGIYGTCVQREGVGDLAAHTPPRAGHRPISSPWGPGSAGMDPLRCLIGFCGHVTALKNIIIRLQNAAHKLALESDSGDKWDPRGR